MNSSQKCEIPRDERSGFWRAAQTPRKRLKFPVLSSQQSRGGRVSNGFLRWLKFNLVGGIGIGVQVAALAVLRSVLQVDYLLATALAVETAVLHNFLWHERFTWPDRGTSGLAQSLIRLAKFNVTNGAVSILGNLLLMRVLVGEFKLNYMVANLIAIAACSLVNFLLSDRFVFERDDHRFRDKGDVTLAG